MNQIGFKNFRRFKQLQPKDLGDITILVGANNAGKSTLVKGLLLALDNIRVLKMGRGDSALPQNPEFRFDADDFHDLGIGTFNRALYNKRDKDEIGFFVRLSRDLELIDDAGNKEKRKADFSITLFVSGDATMDQTTGTISRILVWDNTRKIKFDFNYDAGATVIEFDTKKTTSSEMRKKLEARIAQIQQELDACYKESQMLKEQIAEKQAEIKYAAREEVELQDMQAQLSRENAELAARMAAIDATSPNSIKEMEEVSMAMEELRARQRELRNRMAHGVEANMKDVMSRLNILSNNILMKIAEKNAELDKLQKSLELMAKEDKSETKSKRIELDIVTFMDNVGNNFILNQIDSIISYSGITAAISDEDKNDEKKFDAWQDKEANKAFIHERAGLLRELSEDLSHIINGISAEYIHAHSASQNVFYDTANKNDHIAKAIHRFHREKILDGSVPHTFIKTWMKELGIGDNFKIESFGGEAYRFYVFEGKEKMDLADKGMGSNQLMILLISLATIIRKYEHTNIKPVIVIEEPEQNLHPDLQRKLMELLAYVNNKYGFRFIVETHSEYMIRRSQVLVAEQKYKDEKDLAENCPYKVYYFPKDGEPYDMEYTVTGRFGKPFGKNFYDAAAQDSIALNKMEIASRNK